MTTADVAAPLVSVVIPCYNTERYLADAIESVLGQGVPSLDILVVDDGSTDASADVVRRFAPHVRYVHQANGGISVARNRGVAETHGATLAFLDADDLWPAGSLRGRLDRLRSEPKVEAVFGGVEPFVSPELHDAGKTFAVPSAMIARMASSMLIDRAAFLRVGFFDPQFRTGEMLDWVARAEHAGLAMASVPAVVLRRRIHGANTVLKERQLQSDYFRVLKSSIARRRGAGGSDTPA